MNTVGYFEIQSSDPPREIKLYEAVFGWKFLRQQQALTEYCRIETGDNTNGGLLKRRSATPPTQRPPYFVCFIEVGDFDKTAALILHGATVALPKFAIPRPLPAVLLCGCRSEYFRDFRGE